LMFCIITGLSVLSNFIISYLIIHRRYVTYGLCKDLLDVAIEYFFRFPHFGICSSKINH
jgi:hypothetical protein